MNEFWFILFTIVLLFGVLREGHYLFIYYTIWTFTLETIFFGLLVAKREKMAAKIFPFIYAPAIVVCVGFWVIIAPAATEAPITNIVLTIVTHGLNMIALLLQPYKVYHDDLWKGISYTIVYNLFLAIYVGSGGRSISGKLPYWYAQYDRLMGWGFAGLAISAVTLVHLLSSSNKKRIEKHKPSIV